METERDPLADLMGGTTAQPASPGNAPAISVGDLSRAIKRTLEGDFGHVRVQGEVTGAKRAASGHWYFRLKDDRAVIDAVLWRGQAGKLATLPEDGLEVVATGRVTTYEGRSVYQLVVDSLEPAGVGALLKLLEERRKQLAAEGLFDAERKRPLPFLPEVIGVVTSPTGAVIRDILHRLQDRFPRRVLVWPIRVQGQGAAEEAAAAIRGMNALPPDGPVPRPDVLIVARGGGSLEDLWAFNEEIVVRAAAASEIPLISAVGHETDTTLIDYASDRRAPTPTAAAEMAVPVRADLMAEARRLGLRLTEAAERGVVHRRDRLAGLARGLPAPDRLLETAAQRLDDWGERLAFALRSGMTGRRDRLARLAASLPSPREQIAAKADAVAARAAALDRAAAAGLDRKRHGFERLDPMRRLAGGGTRRLDEGQRRLERLSGLLESYSHEKTLARGFVLVRADGRVLTDPAEATPGRTVELQFAGDQRRQAVIAGGPGAPSGAAGARPRRRPARKPSADDDQGSLL